MKSFKILYLLVWIFIFLPASSILAQERNEEITGTDSLTTVDGIIVCINEEIAKLRNTKPMCDKYGHLYGLKTSDGTIWSFMINPMGKKMREDSKNLKKKVRVWGRLFHKAKMIEVKEYKILKEYQNDSSF